ncbi:MAG: hypothetical protein K8U03_12175 [Planctomycetia bacterium]|nr:hypothetical protein [Planctomycetia bacterium]
MPEAASNHAGSESAMEGSARCHLLGTLPLDDVLALQQRLVYEASGHNERSATILLCEHPPIITIGRHGSRSDVRLSDATLARDEIEVRWLNRGGGALLHAPGQLAVYVVLPLKAFGYSVGEYVRRLQRGLEMACEELHFVGVPRAGRRGVWSRAGQAVFVAAAVKSSVSYFGAYLNVDLDDRLLHAVATDPTEGTEPISLARAMRRQVRMPSVRQSIVSTLSTALGCERYHLFTGHPLLARTMISPKDAARAG